MPLPRSVHRLAFAGCLVAVVAATAGLTDATRNGGHGVVAAARVGTAAGSLGAAPTTPRHAAPATTKTVIRTATATGTADTSGAAATLADRVRTALHGSTAGVIGARVDVGGLGTVVARNHAIGLPPASTEKVFTGATVLARIGADTRLATRFRIYGTRSGHRVIGHLVLVGGGDPTLSSWKLGRVARSIAAHGITGISGGVVVDPTRYDFRRSAPGWKSSFVGSESGALSAVVVDGNSYSSWAVDHPAAAAGVRMQRALAKAGVWVPTTVTVERNPGGHLVYSYTAVSPTVGTVVREMLQDSINFYAEELLKELGARAALPGTSSGGVDVVRREGDALGVPVATRVVDGSGLSSYDRQTPDTEVSWLKAVRASSIGDSFRHSLSVACRVGTLRYRMCGTAAEGRVWAKTGTLDGVRCLAGYTTTRSGRRVTFSFLLSKATYGPSATAAIDRAVVVLASYGG